MQAKPGTLKFEEMHAEVKEKLEKTNVDFGKAIKVGSKVFSSAEVVEPKSARMKSCLAEVDGVLQNCAKAHHYHTLLANTTQQHALYTTCKY